MCEEGALSASVPGARDDGLKKQEKKKKRNRPYLCHCSVNETRKRAIDLAFRSKMEPSRAQKKEAKAPGKAARCTLLTDKTVSVSCIQTVVFAF